MRTAAEDGSSNGGSGSPSPGDTLPWNLGKTQRSRRSGGGSTGNGSVLDPAERAVIRIAGKRRASTSKRWLVALAARSAALRAGVGAGRTGEARGSERPCPRDCRQHSATYWPHRSLHRRHHRPHDPAQRPSALRILSWVPGAELPAGPWSWLPPRGAVEARPQDRRVPPCARAWPFWGEDGKAR